MKSKGFTLIELLIVVAIIGILAAIAIPNFLNAQVRAKVSKCQADMQAVTTALESYRVDNNEYPPDTDWDKKPPFDVTNPDPWFWRVPNQLTTPIAYIKEAGAFKDPFTEKSGLAPSADEEMWRRYEYVNFKYSYIDRNYAIDRYPVYTQGDSQFVGFGSWSLSGWGPDQVYGPYDPVRGWWTIRLIYDPTNGTASSGDIIRCQKFPIMKQNWR